MKRWTGLLLAVFLAFMTLWGCTGSSTDKAGSGGTVELKYWMHKNDAFDNANKKLVQDFETANPGIKIKIEIFPYDDYVQKIRTAYIGNQAPDVAQVFGTWVTPLAKAGLLAEVPNGSDILAQYYQAATGAYTVDGKLYGVPREFNLGNGGILVNTDMMAKANVQPPQTWNELVDAAKKLTEYDANHNIKIRGFDFISGDSVCFLFLSMILQQGGTYWTKDDMVNFSTPEATNAFSVMRDFVTVHKVTDLNLLSGKLGLLDYFFKGQMAMEFDGPWVIAAGLATYGESVKFKYVPMPSFTDQPPAFAAESGWGEIVSAKSKHIQEAMKFVDFVSQRDNNIYWNTQTGTIPAAKDHITEKYMKDNEILKPSFDAMQYGQWIGPFENTDYFKKVLIDGYSAVVKGADVEGTLKKIEQDVNANILKERKK